MINAIVWMVLCTAQGSVYKIDPFDLFSKPKILFEHNCSAFIGIDVLLADSSHCMVSILF